jgi:hypothetical protein
VAVSGDGHDPELLGVRPEGSPIPDRGAIEEQLARILSSPPFATSRRSQQLLKYLVEHTLAGDLPGLKERTIGVEVFGRDLEYDTSADAIVRVRANELRKRLAQYYERYAAGDAVRIDLPPGSYAPRFSWLGATEAAAGKAERGEPEAAPALHEPAALVEPRPRSWRRLRAAGLVAFAVAAAAVLIHPRLASTVERFWEPVLEAPQPVVVCIPARERLFLDDRVRETLVEAGRSPGRTLSLTLEEGDVVAVPQAQMSVQNVRAILSLSRFLGERRTAVQFRLVPEVAFDDIGQSAVILVGAYHNPWAEQLARDLRFAFESRGAGSREVSWIRDRRSQAEPQWIVHKLWPYASQPVDYAIITRLFDRSSNRVVISFAGINGFGTQVAAEFLTGKRYWGEFARLAPKGWERRNCQIVLETKVVGLIPNPPRILAIEVW